MSGGARANELLFGVAGRNTVTDFDAAAGDRLVVSNAGSRLELAGAARNPKTVAWATVRRRYDGQQEG
jgi:hypothetical protein